MLRVESKLSRKVILEYKNPQESEGERKKKESEGDDTARFPHI